jgi:hypothetical protein
LSDRLVGGAKPDRRNSFIIVAVVLLLAYAGIRSVFNAAIHLLWFDELCAWFVVQQANLHAVWVALLHGTDSQPPPLYLVLKLCRHFIPSDEVALRVPSAIGFCCMLGFLFL